MQRMNQRNAEDGPKSTSCTYGNNSGGNNHDNAENKKENEISYDEP